MQPHRTPLLAVAVALLLLSSSVSALTAIAYASRNVTVTNANGQLNLRSSSLSAFSVPGILSGVFVNSLSLTANPNTAQLDGVFGAGYTSIGTLPPSFYLCFFDVAANFNVGTNAASASVNASAAFIGKSYLMLEEVNPQGAVVATTNLKDLVYTLSASSMGTGGLRFAAFTGTTIIPSAFTVTVNFAVSDVVGLLNVPGTPLITPKSAETILEINNYNYAATTNSLRLSIGVATGQAAGTSNANFVTLSSGTGTSATYVQLATQAQVNGNMQAVSVSAFVDGNANTVIQNGNIQAQVTARYGGNATFKVVTVTFPAGAAQILYDPAMGVGTVPVASSSFIAPSFLMLLAALFFAF